MTGNYLEQLAAEWYEYQGYVVRRNIFVGKLARGGYECELDIVAFNPVTHHLVHVEPSMDADSWATRERRYRKKFEAGQKYIPSILEGFQLPKAIEQIALLVFASKRDRETLAGGKLLLIPELLEEILAALRTRSLASSVVPEHLPLIRTLQFVAEYRKNVLDALS